MSDDDDLFGSSGSDGGDTDDLIAAAHSKKAPAPIAKKKKRLQKKKASTKKRKRDIPDADNNDDSGDNLFDDSDDDEPAKPQKPLTKKERMEALQAKKRQEMSPATKSRTKKKKSKDGTDEKDYDSGDSYDSREYVRTQEDNDFIDTAEDDPDAINELYAEQHFDDERPDGSDEEDQPKKKKASKGSGSRKKGPDAVSDDDEDNPLIAAVNKMKRKKKVAKKLPELEEEAKMFLNKMDAAAEEDEKAVEERRPAVKKLAMLNEVCDMLARRDIVRILLDFDLLIFCKRWIQPLPSGVLGNVTVRQRLLEAISNMQGEQGITSNDLKRSSFGKVVMSLYMHKDETPAMKRQMKSLIEQWSRPIFQKSGNMRDLEHVHSSRRQGGLVAISRAQQQQQQMAESAAKGRAGAGEQDLHSMIASGTKGARDIGNNRVRVPFSKGFQFTVRPQDKTGNVMDKRMVAASNKDNRGNLNKRMIEKGRASAKNQRSANISIEGRPAK